MLIIAGNELRRLFRSPLAFALGTFTLFLTGYAGMAAVLSTREATARYAINSMAALFLIAVPLLTMRALAEERASGRLDLLFASPVSTTKLVLGKFIGTAGFASLLVAVAIGVQLYPVLRLGHPDRGEILAGFIGLELFVGAAVAVSLLWSAGTASVLVAGLGSTVTLLLLWFSGSSAQALPGVVGRLATSGAPSPRLEPFTFGLIRTDHVAYFAVAILVTLGATVVLLRRARPLRQPTSAPRRPIVRRVAAVAAVGLVAVPLLVSGPTRFDLTSGRRLTLSSETRRVLAGLDQSVEVTAFLDPSQPDYREARNLVRLYAANSAKIRLRVVNPATDPQLADRYGVQQPGEVIMTGHGRQQWASRASEDRLTVALARLSQGTSSGLACLAINGRGQSESAAPALAGGGYSLLRQLLVSSGYDVSDASSALPSHCDVVILVGGTAPFASGAPVADVLSRSGARSVLVLDRAPDVAVTELLATAGLAVQPHTLQDLDAGDARDPHSILAEARTASGAGVNVLLPGAAPLQVDSGSTAVAMSAASAVEVTDSGEMLPDATPGSKPVAAVVPRDGLSVGLVGNGDFVRNSYLRVADNGEFVVDLVARLAGRQPIVQVRPRQVGLASTSLVLTEDRARLAKSYTTILVPASSLLVGISLTLRRRKR